VFSSRRPPFPDLDRSALSIQNRLTNLGDQQHTSIEVVSLLLQRVEEDRKMFVSRTIVSFHFGAIKRDFHNLGNDLCSPTSPLQTDRAKTEVLKSRLLISLASANSDQMILQVLDRSVCHVTLPVQPSQARFAKR
jgi:hypothetical protein